MLKCLKQILDYHEDLARPSGQGSALRPSTRLPVGEAPPATAVPDVIRTSSQRTSAVSWDQRAARQANVPTLLASGDIAGVGTNPPCEVMDLADAVCQIHNFT